MAINRSVGQRGEAMNRIKNSSGFTLVEVIISIAILGIISIAMLNMFTLSLETIFSMGNKTTATRIAQDFMDAHYAKTPIAVNGYPTAPVVSGYIISSADISQSGMHKITITVTYRNNTRSVQLVSLVP